ncbi:WecB/TagA/CpsF family glycosyltransferase [Lacimicrobium sp. SS2-24]|uniref:WecB/TagA/CpsF family glycosyltransferase n=1 Tax=Lacimicrobium sp. SS2-24 TaxID=2005569 RepID=UPI000B4AA1E1|nr:WecB/TagA/CpsF family glycosyltransferase [Lacimicrobium sp. SS2-24]
MKNMIVDIGNFPIRLYKDKPSLLKYLFDEIESDQWPFLVSINPEKIITQKHTGQLVHELKPHDICYADGIGVVKAVERKSGIKIARIPGCELWESLMQEAGKRGLGVFLVGAKPDVLEETRVKLGREYHTKIVDAQHGYFDDEQDLIQRIKQSGAQIVTVALGSPKQESFIFKCREAGIKAIFMGVGGTYDVYTGHVTRAPALFCNLGLEWLYRLLSQPTRWRRQLRLIHFTWLMLTRQL